MINGHITLFTQEHHDLSQRRQTVFFNSLVKLFKFQLGFAFFPKEMHQQRRLCLVIHILSEGKGLHYDSS